MYIVKQTVKFKMVLIYHLCDSRFHAVQSSDFYMLDCCLTVLQAVTFLVPKSTEAKQHFFSLAVAQ